jgi:hypothetical protein
MLITDRFVMLNFPKTGSAFTRDALKQLHRPGRIRQAMEYRGWMKPGLTEHLMLPYFFTETQTASEGLVNSEHGVLLQIPQAHRHKPVFSIVRDPIKRLVSAYEFRSWAKHPIPDLDQAMQWFPNFPDLSFEDFFRMNRELILPYIQPEKMQVQVGPLTTQFIRFYAREPVRTMLSLRENTDLRKDYELHFPQIHFLHTENLNQELHDLLLRLNYSSKRIAFILEKKKKNTTGRSRTRYLTPEQTAQVHQSERFFYQLFPEYLHSEA